MGRVMPSSNVAGILFHLQSRYKLNKESKTKLNKERKIPRGNKLCKKIKQPNVGNLPIFLRKTPHQIFLGFARPQRHRSRFRRWRCFSRAQNFLWRATQLAKVARGIGRRTKRAGQLAEVQGAGQPVRAHRGVVVEDGDEGRVEVQRDAEAAEAGGVEVAPGSPEHNCGTPGGADLPPPLLVKIQNWENFDKNLGLGKIWPKMPSFYKSKSKSFPSRIGKKTLKSQELTIVKICKFWKILVITWPSLCEKNVRNVRKKARAMLARQCGWQIRVMSRKGPGDGVPPADQGVSGQFWVILASQVVGFVSRGEGFVLTAGRVYNRRYSLCRQAMHMLMQIERYPSLLDCRTKGETKYGKKPML